jgi:hypothetical protein
MPDAAFVEQVARAPSTPPSFLDAESAEPIG